MIKKKATPKIVRLEQEEIDNSESTNELWRKQLLDALKNMKPQKFELFCRGLLKKMGIEVDDQILLC